MPIVISGQDLINAGLAQGRWFKPALEQANKALEEGAGFDEALAIAKGFAPPPALALHANALPYFSNIEVEAPEEEANVASVQATMAELMRKPVDRRVIEVDSVL